MHYFIFWLLFHLQISWMLYRNTYNSLEVYQLSTLLVACKIHVLLCSQRIGRLAFKLSWDRKVLYDIHQVLFHCGKLFYQDMPICLHHHFLDRMVLKNSSISYLLQIICPWNKNNYHYRHPHRSEIQTVIGDLVW